MVVKKRLSLCHSADREVLPLTHEYEETREMKPVLSRKPKEPISPGQDVEQQKIYLPEPTTTHRKLRFDHKEYVLPTWANPQDASVGLPCRPSSTRLATRTRSTKSTIVITATKRKSKTQTFLLLALVAFGFFTRRHCSNLLKRVLAQTEEKRIIKKDLDFKLRSKEKEARMLSRDVSVTISNTHKQEDEVAQYEARDAAHDESQLDAAKEELTYVTEHYQDNTELSSALRDSVQLASQVAAAEKYGSQGQRIQIDLVFPDQSEGSFVAEMVPLALMPHSVYTFLEMVSHGLVDGCSFVMNAMHVLKAAPLPFDETTSSEEKVQQFIDAHLNGPVFREHNQEVRHSKYSLGFAAGGSPGWYINTEDNSDIHTGDPVFATIISGFDTIKRLEESPTHNGIWFTDRIGIKRAKLLL